MAYPRYLRERARELRTKNRLSLNEIAERLALPETTVYYWIRGLELCRPRRENPHPGNLAMQAKYRRLREEAYAQGWAEYDELIKLATFRDFVALYIAEGYKRNRNVVSIANSDERVLAIAASWLRVLSPKSLTYRLEYHADQVLDDLRLYWGEVLGIDGSVVRVQRKSNSGQLSGRIWRSRHGVLTVGVQDTLLRARLQAWIDRIREDWGLDSATRHGA